MPHVLLRKFYKCIKCRQEYIEKTTMMTAVFHAALRLITGERLFFRLNPCCAYQPRRPQS
ncbi:hypothetical protein EWI73_07960 [Salmonella bongori]|uniref:Uncharacterized protein n=1 Tax=Salmonella bongori TaxID=54736 RepID=A0A8F8FKS4_SALBN|nr:hypothetical protein [Salmonella bongori]ECG8259632.1 hypothetical protein [Salmonella bongori serovar 48:i:-]QXY83900.1 hypothetical protein EWI73_07960 [Salmonella bongori]